MFKNCVTRQKKLMLILSLLFLCIPSIAAEELGVELVENNNEAEPDGKAFYQVKVTNLQGNRDIVRLAYSDFAIYPFSEFTRNIVITPSQLKLESLESGVFNVTIKVLETSKADVSYETDLRVMSLTKPLVKEDLTIKTFVISPTDVIIIDPTLPTSFSPGETYELIIPFKNRGNIPLGEVEILIASDLPQLQKNFVIDFSPNELIEETIRIILPADETPGEYVLNIKAYQGTKTRGTYVTSFNIIEDKEITESISEEKSFLKTTTDITKKNEGNVNAEQTVTVKMGILKRLFTTASPDPEVKKGTYVWDFTLKPKETYTITFTSNYRPIFYGIIIVILATLLMWLMVQKSVMIKKRMFRIKRVEKNLTEFKVLVYIKNGTGKALHSVRVMDIIPEFMDMAEEFTTLQPTKVQHGTRGKRLIWDINTLAPHEERMISYKVMSRKRLTGANTLPPATLHYTRKSGKVVNLRSAALTVEHRRARDYPPSGEGQQ